MSSCRNQWGRLKLLQINYAINPLITAGHQRGFDSACVADDWEKWQAKNKNNRVCLTKLFSQVTFSRLLKKAHCSVEEGVIPYSRKLASFQPLTSSVASNTSPVSAI